MKTRFGWGHCKKEVGLGGEGGGGQGRAQRMETIELIEQTGEVGKVSYRHGVKSRNESSTFSSLFDNIVSVQGRGSGWISMIFP